MLFYHYLEGGPREGRSVIIYRLEKGGCFYFKGGGGGHAVFRGNIEGSDVAREYQERTMED